MSTQVKNGRVPLSQKKRPSFKASFSNRLGLDDALIEEIESQGLEYRWVDANKMYLNQGYHPNGWGAYKRKVGTTDFKYGNDPDGVIRRGSMILAVRSKDLCQEHRDYLQEKADTLVGRDRKAAMRRHARELQDMAGQGVKISVGDEDQDD